MVENEAGVWVRGSGVCECGCPDHACEGLYARWDRGEVEDMGKRRTEKPQTAQVFEQ